MAGKSQPMSTFAIRFNPASINDDDDDDELYDFAAAKPRKEILQFERRSASPVQGLDVSGATESLDVSVVPASSVENEPVPASHPSMLWKSPAHVVRSAPASEMTSPVSPMKTCFPSEGEKPIITRDIRTQNTMPAVKEDTQKSFFSEMRERIVNQSREILPKRLNKTNSADTAKIVTIQQQEEEKSKIEKEMLVIKHARSRPGSDAGAALAKEILKSGSTECINGEWDKLDDADVLVKRSSSTGQIFSKQDLNDESEHVSTSESSSTTAALPMDVMSMSELMSSASRENLSSNASEAVLELPKPPKTTAVGQQPKHSASSSQGIRNFLPLSRIPEFLKRRSIIALLVLFLSLVLLPLPPFLSGYLIGSFMSFVFAAFVYVCFLARAQVKTTPRPPDLLSLPPLLVPEMKESKNTEGLFKGWMNILSEYDVDNYHINQTHSVFVTLEGSTMRLQTPKQGIAKRAMWDENIPATVSFVRQKHHDLRGCKVVLLPSDLIEKRLWSKKYPICIEFVKHPPVDLTKHNSFGRTEPDANSDSAKELTQVTKASRPVESGHLKLLYLFARSSREKEEWFRRFSAAAMATPWPTRMSDLLQKKLTSSPSFAKSHVRTDSASSIELQPIQRSQATSTDSQQTSNGSVESPPSLETDYGKLAPERNLLEYMNYMAKIMPAGNSGMPASSAGTELCDPGLLWLNAIISRCFLDFLREKYWTNKIRDKIQKKLGKMHVPHFIDQLTVTGIELGPQVPVISRTSKPYLDDRGLWVDMDVSYGGGFCITMETKCNLMKLKSVPSVVREEKKEVEKRSGALYSDEEDSAESTTDEEAVEENSTDEANLDKRSEPMSKKLLKFVDKISKSRYFQQATDYRYIKKAMEEVSNTRLILNVEMKAVVGTLAVNIPSPPTNRIWYGFRGNPNLVLSAKPKVGEREVSLSHITDWIEKKLAIEFQRVFVMPNMDDIPIPLMCEHLPTSQVSSNNI